MTLLQQIIMRTDVTAGATTSVRTRLELLRTGERNLLLFLGVRIDHMLIITRSSQRLGCSNIFLVVFFLSIVHDTECKRGLLFVFFREKQLHIPKTSSRPQP